MGKMSDSDSLEELRAASGVVGGNHHDVQVSYFSNIFPVYILMRTLYLLFSLNQLSAVMTLLSTLWKLTVVGA